MDYKAGMFIYALAFLLGCVYVQQLSVLPDSFVRALLFFCSFLLCFVLVVLNAGYKNCVSYKEITLSIVFILLFLIGIIYTGNYADRQLSSRVDDSLTGKSLLVSGAVTSVPVVNGHVQRFIFSVENIQHLVKKSPKAVSLTTLDKTPRKIRLSWYYGEKINALDNWQFEVRLKAPHGFMNPAGFDYESWLFQHGIDATGYVRKSNLNKKSFSNLDNTLWYSFNRYRQIIGESIDAISANTLQNSNDVASEIDSFALIKALAIGDKSSLTTSQWNVLINTGTSHLMAISGLHIGLAALFAYIVLRRCVPCFIARRIPVQHIALTVGMSCALLYALIAGFSIPTQRAMIMLSVVSIMVVLRRNHRPVDTLGFALLVVLLIDPLSVLAVGFWFSFAAVAAIYISLTTGSLNNRSEQNTLPSKAISTVRGWVKLQFVISLFLLPLSLFMFQQVSIVSPLTNLLLVPYVSFLVVPVVLLGLCFIFILPNLAELLFVLAAKMIDAAWPALVYMSELPNALLIKGNVVLLELLTATAVIILIYYLLNRRALIVIKTNKSYQWLIMCCVFLFAITLFLTDLYKSGDVEFNSGEYEVTVLDVGQGSAAILRTKNHSLVFDAGAKFSDKFDIGRSVVIPSIRLQAGGSLDRLIISHGDSDHIGGAQAIIDEYPTTLLVGQGIEGLQAVNKQTCIRGVQWHWDGVDFEFLSPSDSSAFKLIKKIKRNDSSCVLRVSSVFGSVLFTGDIEKQSEGKLLSYSSNHLASDVLIVPHHGSKTSSSIDFIKAVDAEISIFSVGYKNRYKLPNKKVMNRYKSANSVLFRTDINGAITVKFTAENGLELNKYRQSAAKYWNHRVN